MSDVADIFDSPDKPKVDLTAKEPVKKVKQTQLEDVQQIQEDSAAAGQREKRKRLLSGGRKSTVLSGTQTQLKKRLGE